MQLEIVCCSDKGLVRDHNEDSLANDERLGIVVLADGMGGCQAGEIASAMAVKIIMEELKIPFKRILKFEPLHQNYRITGLLERAIIKANKVIYEIAEQQTRYHGMGTTVVAAIFHAHKISIAHVGDSRLYRLRDNEFKQITVDHSVLQELIDCGFYTREQARHSPNKNLVTRALGVSDIVNVDVQEKDVQLGDIYLLCSDGLNDMLDDSDMHAILKDNCYNLEQKGQRLIKSANERGGEDNISVILVRPLSFSTTKPLENWWKSLTGLLSLSKKD